MKRVLLVEDDPFLTEIYSKKLKDEGFDVYIASEGIEALRKLDQIIPDLVLLDIVLPKIDGWKILEIMRKEKKFKDVKVVVLSNLFEKTDLERGAKYGVTQYLIKAEHTPNEVIEIIKEILK